MISYGYHLEAINQHELNNRPHRSEDATEKRKNPDHTMSYKTWGISRSIRLKNFDYASPGVAYHITIGTSQKQNIFTNPVTNQQIINVLKNSSALYGYHLIAYCLMPDHLHILIQAGENPKDLREFVRGFKSYCSIATRSVATPVATKTNMKMWQRGFYEHILRKEENIADIAEYILNNPVRKGLVQDKGQYKWCDMMMDVERRDRSHDATDTNASVTSPTQERPRRAEIAKETRNARSKARCNRRQRAI